MKKSSMMHAVSIITGIWGFLALIGAWIAGQNGTIWGWTQEHCYINAAILMLVSISAGVCAVYRRQIEREG